MLINISASEDNVSYRQFFFRQGTPDSTDMYWFTRTEGGSTWKRILDESYFTPITKTTSTWRLKKSGHIVSFHVTGCTTLPSVTELNTVWGD